MQRRKQQLPPRRDAKAKSPLIPELDQQKLELLLDSTSIAMLVLDERANIVYANPVAVALAGEDPAALLESLPGSALGCVHSAGGPLGCGLSPDCTRCPLRNAVKAAIDQGQPLAGIETALDLVRKKAVRRIWVRVGVQPISLQGRRHVIVTAEDITASKQAERALYESEERLRAIAASAPDAIICMDHTGQIAFWNPAAEKVFGYSVEEALGKDLHSLLAPPRFHAAFQKNEGSFRENGDGAAIGKTLELVGLRKNGQEFPLELSLARVRHHDQWQAVGIVRDITERREAQSRLEEHAVALELANKNLEKVMASAQAATEAKSEFLANTSHEIRTPLNGVIGMTGLLLDTELTAEQRQYAEIIRSSGESLLTVINDILDFSKIESRKLDLEILDFELHSMLEDIVEMLASKAYQKGLELVCLVGAEVPSLLRGDPARLRQTLVNLIGNAVKFTRQGEVVLRVSVAAQDEHRATLRLEVADTGIGIPPDRFGALFAPFVQVDGSTTRKYGGTGLGLAIAKQLVELMGGQIGVESEPGKSSRFWFTAVLEKQHPRQTPAEEPCAPLAGLKVLVVDDHAANRRLLGGLLQSWGCRCSEAESGAAGLTQLGAAARGGDPFQVALVDMVMPGMSGEAFARAVQADPQLRATPLVLLTSLGQHHDAAQLQQQGFAGYLLKPIRRLLLRNCLTAVVQGTATAEGKLAAVPAAPRSAAAPPVQRARILLAEDNPTNQAVAVAILKKLGHTIDAVANGGEALRALREIPYDLVLMDCQMPEIDGYEATRWIRSAASGVLNPRIPVIAMTAHAMKGDRERCLAAGMDDYLSKPVQPLELAEVVARWHSAPAPESSPPPPADGLLPRPQPEAIQEVFNEEEFLKRLMGDRGLGQAVVRGFLSDIPQQIGLLKEQLGAGDAPRAARQAHTIKGAAATVAAANLREVALMMELAGNSGQGDRLAKLVPQLEEEFARLKLVIEQLMWI